MTDSTDGERRPPIPADIRRRVLVEAGHRCAIPTCRYIEIEIHHIVPWANCQAHEYDNLIALCANCHRRADRGEIDRKALRLYKANLRFTHDKYSQLETDILFELHRLPPGEGAYWPKFNLLLLKRVLDAGYVTAADSHVMVDIGGYDASPAILSLSQKGASFLDSLGLVEL